jgi:hypothetical protein
VLEGQAGERVQTIGYRAAAVAYIGAGSQLRVEKR